MTPDGFAPLPDPAHTVLAQVENEIAVLSTENFAHEPVGFFQSGPAGVFGDVTVGAPIILEEIKTPFGEALRIQFLVLVRADMAGTGERARRSINAGLQTFGVDIVGQRLHIGEPAVGVDAASWVAWRAGER